MLLYDLRIPKKSNTKSLMFGRPNNFTTLTVYESWTESRFHKTRLCITNFVIAFYSRRCSDLCVQWRSSSLSPLHTKFSLKYQAPSLSESTKCMHVSMYKAKLENVIRYTRTQLGWLAQRQGGDRTCRVYYNFLYFIQGAHRSRFVSSSHSGG